ncbi:hydrogenase 4 subunit F [Ellagibacter isourolithinifaciens]|uniref:hydrogenase 4 subunit F n=1 Tax=Ellagibacter isourolithinifaciens TaxID=2137581 RepID=UPI002E783989|nr:hydrogenase 4 subunit F [Ellagibacter isourolithinifaciens]MEE0043622.1 hydrogenase 4 subunit F [Ellagibacter isourolithinifaciens]
MDASLLVLLMLATPLASCLLMALIPAKAPRGLFEAIHAACLVAVFAFGASVVGTVVLGGEEVCALDLWLHVDAVSSIFVGIVCAVALLTGVASILHIRYDAVEGNVDAKQIKRFYSLFSLFVFTMLLVAMSNNLIMMWASIEATTLATVFLVGTYNNKISLEAAWKYLIVCTAGVAFGLYGTLLVYANAADVMANPHQAAFWSTLVPYADQFDHALIQIAFVFIAIGFGTKAGLFPMHTWMPDAYSQAPSPVSGLLSGALAKCAILVVIRFYVLAVQAIGPTFPQTIMLIFGAASIIFGAFALLTQSDFKHKLAYSSCENIGIVALCLGLGGPIGVAAALLHCVFHSLVKSLMFCMSGNLAMKYKTSDLGQIKGVVKVAPVTAVLVGIGLFAISGFPPLALFTSEVLAFVAAASSGFLWLIVIIALALTVVVGAFTIVFLRSILGEAPDGMKRGEPKALTLIPEFALVALLLWFGVALPAPVITGVGSATEIVLQQDISSESELPGAGLFDSIFNASDATRTLGE